jgi:hypothetical protein
MLAHVAPDEHGFDKIRKRIPTPLQAPPAELECEHKTPNVCQRSFGECPCLCAKRFCESSSFDVVGEVVFGSITRGQLEERPIRLAYRHYEDLEPQLPEATNLARDRSVVGGWILADQVRDACGGHFSINPAQRARVLAKTSADNP